MPKWSKIEMNTTDVEQRTESNAMTNEILEIYITE